MCVLGLDENAIRTLKVMREFAQGREENSLAQKAELNE